MSKSVSPIDTRPPQKGITDASPYRCSPDLNTCFRTFFYSYIIISEPVTYPPVSTITEKKHPFPPHWAWFHNGEVGPGVTPAEVVLQWPYLFLLSVGFKKCGYSRGRIGSGLAASGEAGKVENYRFLLGRIGRSAGQGNTFLRRMPTVSGLISAARIANMHFRMEKLFHTGPSHVRSPYKLLPI